MDIGIIVIVVQLIFLEGILSIDNAAVLGAMVVHLPNDTPIPWPRSLSFLSGWSNTVLGPQQQAALKVGLLGAYVGRGTMLAIAGIIVRLPWVRILGATYLFYLAVGHLAELYHQQQDDAQTAAGEEPPIRRVGSGFWGTVLALEFADLAFSVDNVIAAVALSDKLWVVMLGVAIGIIVMRFAATIFTNLIAWEPALGTGAYLLLLAIGTELLLEELFHIQLQEMVQFGISVSILILTVIVARSGLRRMVRFIAQPILALCAGIEWVISGIKHVILWPFQSRSTTSS